MLFRSGSVNGEEDGVIVMKTDRTSRKTKLKAFSAPGGDVLTYDLLHDGPYPRTGALVPFSALIQKATPCDHEKNDERTVFADEYDLFGWFCLLAAESPTAGPLLVEATEAGWQIGLAALGNDGYHLDIPEKTLLIDCYDMMPDAIGRSTYFRNTLLFTFMKALRDIWHEEGLEPFEPRYRPEDVLMLERIRNADCDAVTLLIGWELRGAGYGALWRHLIGTPEGDMALIFSQFLERDPSALFSGTALAYAFRQWFAEEERVNSCDHASLEQMDDVLNITEKTNPFGRKKIDAAAIESLAELPDGSNYLAGLGETIRIDPFFVGLNDPINQTHLLQITYDLSVTLAGNVPFQDEALARKIFPDDDARMLVK